MTHADLTSERALLGAILSDERALFTVLDQVREADFSDPTNAQIWAAVVDLVTEGSGVDLSILFAYLTRAGQVDAANAATMLGDDLAAPGHVQYYARQMLEASRLRQLHKLGQDLQAASAGKGRAPREIADRAAERLQAVMDPGTKRRAQTAGQVLNGVIADLKSRDTARPMSVKTGYSALDKITGGLWPGQFILLAALPSVGKTALALNIAANAARMGRSVQYMTLEMSSAALGQRLLALTARISAQRIRFREIGGEQWPEGATGDWELIDGARAQAERWKLWLDDSPQVSLLDLRARVRGRQLADGLDLVIVDYLQLMEMPRAENRNVQVGALSRQLKLLAGELEIPILALSQLSRHGVQAHEAKPVKKNGDPPKPYRPRLSDLRDSGSLEQDADTVLLLSRRTKPLDAGDISDTTATLDIAKQRAGPTGEVKLGYFPDQTRFEELTGGHHGV